MTEKDLWPVKLCVISVCMSMLKDKMKCAECQKYPGSKDQVHIILFRAVHPGPGQVASNLS